MAGARNEALSGGARRSSAVVEHSGSSPCNEEVRWGFISYTFPMPPESRSHSLTEVELKFDAGVPLDVRQKSLVELEHLNRPNHDTIAAVIPLLNDADDSLRTMAEYNLSRWGQQAVTMLLKALRSTHATEVPYRLAIIAQLGRMGPTALRAETLLRSYLQDPDIGAAADKAVKAIRLDGDDLINRLLHWGVELALLSAVVAAPMIAIRFAAKNQPMPPLGLSIGVASLVVMGLMLARVVFAADLMPGDSENKLTWSGRWPLYLMMAAGGLVIGIALGGLGVLCGGAIQQMVK